MILRGINDQCAALQSKINKKLEILGQYHIYKEFLDDLRPKEVKEAEAAARAEKLEEKERARAQAKSLEPAGAQRRGTRLDPSRSITAQGRAANAASSQGEVDPQAAAQFEVDYPPKIRQLFEDDSSDHSYELPFADPEELMNHFVELEEDSLSLIQQWQDYEQQTELRRQEFEKCKREKNLEISSLQKTVDENQVRSTKIRNEKSVLEA